MMSRMFCRSERMRRYSVISSSSLRCSSAELLLLQVDQLAERHAQDGVGLDGRERVELAGAAFVDEDGEALVAQRPAAAGPRASRSPSAAALASAWVDEVRMTRITSSMLAWASSSPSTVCFRCRALAQQELRAAADHRLAVAEELLQQLLERQHPRLAVDQGQEDQREACLAAARTGRAG